MGGYKRKYKPGEKILTMDAIVKTMETDQFIYLRGKTQHRGWIESMQFRTVASALKTGAIRTALKND